MWQSELLLQPSACADFQIRASYRDEKQRAAHSGRTAVEPLLTVTESSNYHANALKSKQNMTSHSYMLI